MLNQNEIVSDNLPIKDRASVLSDLYLNKKFNDEVSADRREHEKALLLSFTGNEQNLALLDQLSSIETARDDHSEIIIKSIFDLITSETIAPDQLPCLVRSFVYSDKVNPELVNTYGQDSNIEWNDFNITIKPKLFQKNSAGNFEYDIAHDISHELSHSIIAILEKNKLMSELYEFDSEEETFDLDEIANLLSQLDNLVKADSKHINELQTKGKADPSLVTTERLAEVIGAFMASGRNKQEFLSKRTASIVPNESSQGSAEEIVSINEKIFNLLESSWPKIQESIQGHDPNEDFNGLSADQLSGTSGQSEYSSGQVEMPASSSQGSSSSRNYGESSSLGRNDKDNGLIDLCKNFIVSFAGEIPNVQ